MPVAGDHPEGLNIVFVARRFETLTRSAEDLARLFEVCVIQFNEPCEKNSHVQRTKALLSRDEAPKRRAMLARCK
jgi:hypothetical protein